MRDKARPSSRNPVAKTAKKAVPHARDHREPAAPPAKRPAQAKKTARGRDGAAAGEMPVSVDRPGELGFPVVAIGASAGGLEAIEQFLRRVPPASGMAFVVVQHLDPTHKGALVELLQRTTPMAVAVAQDGQVVAANCVYVIPPNRDMSIRRGALQLAAPALPRGRNLPIDLFFRSLAEDQGEGAIGVVLSGMGSDGTLGLRAIKERAGATFVQSLESANFDGMPRSAIDAGVADVVAPAEELADRVRAYHERAPYRDGGDAALHDKQGALDKIFVLLRMQTGNDFSLYKKSTVERRIQRRMSLHQIPRASDYVRYLRANPSEVDQLFNELLIGVTSFFRDTAAWERLRSAALPRLVEERAGAKTLRAWVPGCSTGEEAYSLAILFKEALDLLKLPRPLALQIFATDLDKEAIDRARTGVYPANIAADVSPERLRRFFVQDDRGFRVSREIRESVVFAPQNIIMDPPFTKLDILCCRNLLIYLSGELQKKIIPLFHYALRPGGVLFLGSAETVGAFTAQFPALDGKARLYRRADAGAAASPVDFPSAFASPVATAGPEAGRPQALEQPKGPAPHLQAIADRMILQRFSPAVVVTNAHGDILYISGRTGKYLEPAMGKATLNVLAMARDGLRFELSSAFSLAVREERVVITRGVKVGTNGGAHIVDLTIQPIGDVRELRGTVMIVIQEVQTPLEAATPAGRRTRASARFARIEQDLQYAREEVQTSREEMQTSQEELKSTNEELQSTNEELQSSNEELTTSKEEMQSMNEELHTVNQELQAKVDELSRSNNDMKNLLNSTDIATLFLDDELRVRRFTTQTAKIIKLIPGDAGRPITDIATELVYEDLAEDAREVLRTLVFKEKQVSARDGRWFAVRIMPYRTLENVIDGLVITFTDTTSAMLLGQALREQTSQARQMAESLPNLIWACRPDGSCDYLSRQWVAYTGIPEGPQLGYGWLDRVHDEDRQRLRSEWDLAVANETRFASEARVRSGIGELRWFKVTSAPIRDEHDKVVKWYGAFTDIDELKNAAEVRNHAATRLAGILEGVTDAFFALDDRLAVTFVNRAAERLLDRGRDELLGRRLVDAYPEAAGTVFEERCRLAVAARQADVFDAQLQRGASRGWYTVRVYPHPTGVSVFFQARDARADTLAPGDANGERDA